MEAFLAWLLVSPIGKALIGAAVAEAIAEFQTLIAGLQRQVADHQATLIQISMNFEKLRALNDNSTAEEIRQAIDEASRHL